LAWSKGCSPAPVAQLFLLSPATPQSYSLKIHTQGSAIWLHAPFLIMFVLLQVQTIQLCFMNALQRWIFRGQVTSSQDVKAQSQTIFILYDSTSSALRHRRLCEGK
jgi:hypothetical protein